MVLGLVQDRAAVQPMKLQRKYFFDSVRTSLFGGSLSQSQVEGMNAILDYAELDGVDDRHLAYVLATSFHETGKKMQPVEEIGHGQGHEYGYPDPQTGKCYYGRGHVQITWKSNYQAQDKKLGLDDQLVWDPDLALDPLISLQILFGGMRDGDFTGVCLNDFIACSDPDTDETDFYNSRKIVNGLDRADTIEGYAYKFAHAIMHQGRQK